jgi:hypothetical protein
MAKDNRIVAGVLGDSKYYYASDGSIVDEDGKPAPAKFAAMFPPMPEKAPEPAKETKPKKTRRKLKDLAGKLGNSKYYYDAEGNVVDEEGKPVNEKLASYFGKREAISKALPKVEPKKQTNMIDNKSLRVINAEVSKAIRSTQNLAQSNEIIQNKMPTMFDSFNDVVKTLSDQNDIVVQRLIQQNQDFQDKVVETLTGVRSATKAGGAKPKKINPRAVGGSKAAKGTELKVKATNYRETRRKEVEDRAKRIAEIRFKRNIAAIAAGSMIGAAGGVAAGAIISALIPPSAPAGGGGAGGGPQQAPSAPGGTPSGGMTRLTTRSGKSFDVATEYASNFKGFVNELEETGYVIKSIGGYANRNIAGTGKKSYHSLGAAIDINPSSNPHLFDGRLQTDMPSNVGAIAAKYGLGWGGNWRTSKDAMHFSIAAGEGGSIALDRNSVAPLPGSPQAQTADSGSGPMAAPAAPSTGTGGVGSIQAPGGAPTRSGGGGSFSSQAPGLMNRLQSDFGLTPVQAAGIVGNLAHESAGLQAGIQQRGVRQGRGGLGWAQWTGPRRRAFEAYLAETGQDATDPEANYGFLKRELTTTHRKALAALKQTNDIQNATIVFENLYEAAGVKHYGSRLSYANQALKLSGEAPSQTQVAMAGETPKAYAAGDPYVPNTGPAIVGERGPELVIGKDGSSRLTGDGPVIENLNKGDSVIPADKTKKMFPAYAGGTSELMLDSDWQPYLDKEKHARYIGGRPDAMSDDERNEYEGFKTKKQYGNKDSLWNQKVAHPNAEAAAMGYTVDRGDAEEMDVRARLRRGERVDPDNPPGTMTKRELASRIQQEGMPALASGAYTPEEFQKITRNAGKFQWQADAEEKFREAEKEKKKPQPERIRPLVPLAPAAAPANTDAANFASLDHVPAAIKPSSRNDWKNEPAQPGWDLESLDKARYAQGTSKAVSEFNKLTNVSEQNAMQEYTNPPAVKTVVINNNTTNNVTKTVYQDSSLPTIDRDSDSRGKNNRTPTGAF